MERPSFNYGLFVLYYYRKKEGLFDVRSDWQKNLQAGHLATDSMMKIGAKILRVRSCSSTNDLANAMALQGEEEGTVVIAEEQTEGRGTKGRVWFSEKAMGLYISVILRPRKRDLSLLPLVAGLAVRDVLSEMEDLPVELKWPNDLVCSGKKLGGILCEASFLGNEISHAILGFGLNVYHNRRDFPDDFRSQATSLKILLKKDVDIEALLAKLWKILDDWYGFFLEGKEVQIVRAFEEFSVYSEGETLAVSTEKKRITGEYMGIDTRGRLLLRTQGFERSFLAAEVLEIRKEFKED
jgi:BirA family biotin operon repressor/biotin-[acetyl-CoA-carboxylase] ligase